LWNLQLGNQSSICPPACRDGVAYVQVIRVDNYFYLYAVNLTSQEIMWTSSGLSTNYATYDYGAVPDPVNGLIYAPGGRSGEYIYAFNPDGSLNFTGLVPGGGTDSWTPTAWKDRPNEIYTATIPTVQYNQGTFGVNDALTGVIDWSFILFALNALDHSTQSVVAVSNGVGLVSLRANGVVADAIELKTQVRLWNIEPCDGVTTPSGEFRDQTLSTDGKVAAIACSDKIQLFDLYTGDTVYTFDCYRCGGQPIITPNYVLATGLLENTVEPVVYILSRSGGQNMTLPTGGNLILSGDVVYVTSMMGYVTAYQLVE